MSLTKSCLYPVYSSAWGKDCLFIVIPKKMDHTGVEMTCQIKYKNPTTDLSEYNKPCTINSRGEVIINEWLTSNGD